MRRIEINYRTVITTALITVVTMSILLYAPSPFVVTKPGIAVSTERYVKLANGKDELHDEEKSQDSSIADHEGRGDLLLTAVMLEAPDMWHSIGAMFNSSYDVRLKRDVLGGASLEEYAATVTTMMKGSHQAALEAAYRHLNIAYSNEPQQIKVQQVNHGNSASSLFKSGDVIIAGISEQGENEAIHSMIELASWLKGQAVDGIIENASMLVQRDDTQQVIALKKIKLDSQLSEQQMAAKALGINSFIELRDIIPEQDQYKVDIATDNIGGPSAGLVFALTVIDKLTAGDLTKGKKIAATGTIDVAGHVGVIGGIVQKVHTTSKQGVELFIVPKGNEKAAKRTLKSIDSTMQIAGVSSLEEAIELIASLK